MDVVDAFGLLGIPIQQRAAQREISTQAQAEAFLEEQRTEALKTYRERAKLAHPDRGGDPKVMAMLNAAKEEVEAAKIEIEEPQPVVEVHMVYPRAPRGSPMGDYWSNVTTTVTSNSFRGPAQTTRGFYAG